MAFESVTNLAQRQAAEDERRRREEQQRLERDLAEQKASETEGPAALLETLTGGRRVGVDPATMQAAEEDRFLNQQAQRRLDRRADTLAVPLPTMPERMAKLLGPAAAIADEDPSAAANELRTDPRGRLARLEAVKEQMLGDVTGVPRETRPIYYSGNRNPSRGPAAGSGVTPAGDGPETMPYTGALEGLRGADVPRAAIRPEFGGTAPDETLRFSDRPEPGMRRYNAPSGATKDVGAPGGGFAVVHDMGRGGRARDAVTNELDALIGEARRQPLTPTERAQDLVKEEPMWDVQAAGLRDPGAIHETITRAVASGELDPATGQYLQKKYQAYANASTDEDGEFDPDEFASRLATNRAPAPGEAEARAKSGGGQVPAVEAEKHAAVADAQAPVPNAPGTTVPPDYSNGNGGAQAPRSATPAPDATEGPGFFAALGSAARRGAQTAPFQGAPAPETPPGLPSTAARIGVPLAAGLLAPELSIPAAAAVGFGGGAGGELLGELLGDETVNPRAIGGAGALGAAGGALAGPAARLAGRGFAAVRALGRRMASPIEGVWEGAPALDVAGTRGMQAPARVAAKVYAQNPLEPPSGPIPYRTENLPALPGGGGFTLGPGSPVEAAARPLRTPRLLTGPPGALEGELLPPVGMTDDVLEGELLDPREALLRMLVSRNGGEGAKQLVPRGGVAPDLGGELLDTLRGALAMRRGQGVPVQARDVAELLAMLQRAGG